MHRTLRSIRGASLVEALTAITILAVGILGLLGTSALVNRLLGLGSWATVTAGYATARIESLRGIARDSAGCSHLASGSRALPGGLTESWTVVPGARAVTVEVVIARPPASSDTLETVIPC